jgi:hypothetical protein
MRFRDGQAEAETTALGRDEFFEDADSRSAGMPEPVSATWTCTSAPARDVVIVTRPPASVA